VLNNDSLICVVLLACGFVYICFCSYICRTDPADVARVESKTYIVTKDKFQTLPRAKEGAKGGMGQWMAPDVMQKEMDDRFRNCMAGTFVYVQPVNICVNCNCKI